MPYVGGDDIGLSKEDFSKFAKIDKEIRMIKKQIKPHQMQLRELNRQRKELEKDLSLEMCENQVDDIFISSENVNISYIKSTVNETLNLQIIKQKMDEFYLTGPGSFVGFSSQTAKEKSDALYKYIYIDRAKIIKEKLKLTDTFG